jgi:hypothetical protein
MRLGKKVHAATPVGRDAIMRRLILNQVVGSAEAVLFDASARDNCTEPYIMLRERANSLGYCFEGVRDQPLDECEWVIFWDTRGFEKWSARAWLARRMAGQRRDMVREVFSARRRPKLALMLFEPSCIVPSNGDVSIHRRFDVVFTWNPALVASNPRLYTRIFLPSPEEFPRVGSAPFEKKKLLCDVSGYKFSSQPGELYTERRKTIRFFDERFSGQFDLWGVGWNPSGSRWLKMKLHRPLQRLERVGSYRGPVASKAAMFPRYRFALCFENSSEAGYISVRLMDCLRSDVIPVYLGAPDVLDYVDSEAFVDRRAFASLEALGRFLAEMRKGDYEAHRAAARRYLAGERSGWFRSTHFVNTVVKALGLEQA